MCSRIMKNHSSRPSAPKRFRTLWISDIHLGTKDYKAAQLNNFLKHHEAEQIYLVGDIIDGWRMKSGVYWNRDFTRVVRRLLKLSKQGTPITYICGKSTPVPLRVPGDLVPLFPELPAPN